MKKSIVIIGAGASGLCAAIEAAQTDKNCTVTVFEKLPKAAKKITVTGNGRCNFTNTDLSAKNFHGEHSFLKSILTSPYADSDRFFRSLGVLPYFEDGRIYPRSQQAGTIRDALLRKAEELGVKIITESAVTKIEENGTAFTVNGVNADAVIIAGGGKAAPVHGTDGSAYALLMQFGHDCSALFPALSALSSREKLLRGLKGVRAQCDVSLFDGREFLGTESGEVQFNENSVSGIPVLDLSYLCRGRKNLHVQLDLCPEYCSEELSYHITDFINNSHKAETEAMLSGIVNIKLGYAIMEKAGIAPHTTVGKLKSTEISSLLSVLKCFDLSMEKAKDFEFAQITEGGIDVNEFDPQTMMSKLKSGIFACGEILDIHGKCGGYNLHLAWTMGRIAGTAAAEYINKTEV